VEIQGLALKQSPQGVQDALEEIRETSKGSPAGGVAAVRYFPPREARLTPFPEFLSPRLVAILEERGIHSLYSHQSAAASLAQEGSNLVVVTPTASGKTLCYNLPVLNTLVENPDARAVYLFPTKALSQDQLVELNRWTEKLGEEIRTFTYDGDTPQDARKSIRGRANLVITNPDMLHTGILPHHTRWERFFENLRYVVIDELHYYRGVFGSHLANVLRRLKRVAGFYGSKPQFICTSATIANPVELAQQILEEDVTLVDENGAPSSDKYFVFYNPPVVNPQLGIRRSYLNETRRVARAFLSRQLQTIVFANSRLATEILVTYLKEDFSKAPVGPDVVRGYRGGYLPFERRRIECELREARLLGVVATNALELGIDVGTLDVAVLAGYPGTIASTWQRVGRAGRREGTSAAVLVASSAPLDQFMVNNPDYFFGHSPEHGYVNPDNLQILLNHLKCAAFELPLGEGEKFGSLDLKLLCRHLEEAGFLHRSSDGWHWVSESYPADAISLRSVSSDNFVIVDTTKEPQVIGEVDFSSALTMVHEKAIYIQDGTQYHVERLDYDDRKAYVHRVDSEYYTDAISYTKIRILETFDSSAVGRSQETEVCRAPSKIILPCHSEERSDEESASDGAEKQIPRFARNDRSGDFQLHWLDKGPCDAQSNHSTLPSQEQITNHKSQIKNPAVPTRNHGEVRVNTQVVGFKKIKFHTNENVGSGELTLPEQEMHTTSYWLTLPCEWLQKLPYSSTDRQDGVHGLGNALRAIATLLVMCDARDLGVAVGENENQTAESRKRKAEDDLPSQESERSRRQRLTKDNELRTIFEPNIYLYDRYPGGVGFSEPLYHMNDSLLANTFRLIAHCPCQAGCPSCVGPAGEVGEQGKEVALAILRAMGG
jgi:DEAD/DEAH box helicase domain-containing protein